MYRQCIIIHRLQCIRLYSLLVFEGCPGEGCILQIYYEDVVYLLFILHVFFFRVISTATLTSLYRLSFIGRRVFQIPFQFLCNQTLFFVFFETLRFSYFTAQWCLEINSTNAHPLIAVLYKEFKRIKKYLPVKKLYKRKYQKQKAPTVSHSKGCGTIQHISYAYQ